jgi:cell division inhibitor SepF
MNLQFSVKSLGKPYFSWALLILVLDLPSLHSRSITNVSFLSKLKDIVGLNDQDEYDYEYEDVEQQPHGYADYAAPTPASPAEAPTPRAAFNAELRSKTSNVIGMPGVSHGASEMVLIEPRAFEEMPQVIDALRQRKSVILNMTLIRQEEAQRAVDFVAGGTYAIDGHYERIGDNIFLFTPSCVQVSTPTNVLNEVVQAPARTHRSVTPGNPWASEAIAQ